MRLPIRVIAELCAVRRRHSSLRYATRSGLLCCRRCTGSADKSDVGIAAQAQEPNPARLMDGGAQTLNALARCAFPAQPWFPARRFARERAISPPSISVTVPVAGDVLQRSRGGSAIPISALQRVDHVAEMPCGPALLGVQ